MHPWYRGFNGTIAPMDKGQSYQVSGIITQVDETTLRITELPVRKWTQVSARREWAGAPGMTASCKPMREIRNLRHDR
jgi:hypothetical protein